MQESTKSAEVFTELAGKALETLTAWADANQRVVRELVNFSAATAKEGARLYAELQGSAVAALREGHAYWVKHQTEGPEIPKDPILWCQRGIAETIEGAQKAVRFIEGGAQALTRSAEQFQTAAEQTGKELQATLSGLATRVHEIFTAA